MTLVQDRQFDAMRVIFGRAHPQFLQILLNPLNFPQEVEYLLVGADNSRGDHGADRIINSVVKIENIPSIGSILNFLRVQSLRDFFLDTLLVVLQLPRFHHHQRRGRLLHFRETFFHGFSHEA